MIKHVGRNVFRHVNSEVKYLLLSLCLLTTSCASFLPERSKPDEGTLPSSWSSEVGIVIPQSQWWKDFSSNELNILIEQGFVNNLTLRQAWARLIQAGAAATKAGAGMYPSLDLSESATRKRSLAKPGPRSGLPGIGSSEEIGTNSTDYRAGFAASYELDLWGRVRSGRRAAVLDHQAGMKNFEAAAVTIAAGITDRWLRLIEQRQQVQLLKEQLTNNKASLANIEERLRKGQATALDVYQQRQTVAQVSSSIPLAEATEQLLVHELNLLLGRPASAKIAVATAGLPQLPPLPQTGLPADLLGKRPDVQAALLNLHAADQRVAAARADRLPAIRLTGSHTFQDAKTSRLFDNWLLNLGASLTAPLLDGGLRSAEVRRTLAVTEERLGAYRESVLVAIKEVEDALLREQKHKEYLTALRRQLGAASQTYTTAWDRYRSGQSTYLSTLTALVSHQALERDVLRVERELLGHRVSLYRALGGSWTQHLLQTYAEQKAMAEIMVLEEEEK